MGLRALLCAALLASCRAAPTSRTDRTHPDSIAAPGAENRPGPPARAPDTVTADSAVSVAEASTAIDLCYHWAGEVGDQSEERNRQITAGIERDCPEAERKARRAYSLSPKSPALAAKLLELIDIGYFKVTDAEKGEICEAAALLVRDENLQSKVDDALFRGVCPAQASKLYGR